MNYSDYIKHRDAVDNFYKARQKQPVTDIETIVARLRDIEDYLSRNCNYEEYLFKKYFSK